MGIENDRERTRADDEYRAMFRRAQNKDYIANRKVEVECAGEILRELNQHISQQMKRYGSGPKYNAYVNLQNELKDLSPKIVFPNDLDLWSPEEKKSQYDQNIKEVLAIMKKTGEASQEPKNSLWTRICEYFNIKREVKSWKNFKDTIETIKIDMENVRNNAKKLDQPCESADKLSSDFEKEAKQVENTYSQYKP